VAAWGEERLITAIRGWLGNVAPPAPRGMGDDCAVLPSSRSQQLLTVDPVILGRHFDETTPPAQVGAKLLKRNVSDIAAMGGRPRFAVIALTLDRRLSRRWLAQFHRGLAAAARRFGIEVVGGDVAQGKGFSASLTLLGIATSERVLTRRGARRGDHIFVTGVLGGSLKSGHHWRFTPRLAEGAWLVRQPEVRSMMDVSDGLAKDLHALEPANAEAAIEAHALPIRAGATLRQALSEGEDYELVFTVGAAVDPADFGTRWRRCFPRTRLSRIGHFCTRGSRAADTITLLDYHGYEHLR
jgi:thiamine-monophosphate kinase